MTTSGHDMMTSCSCPGDLRNVKMIASKFEIDCDVTGSSAVNDRAGIGLTIGKSNRSKVLNEGTPMLWGLCG
jgi:hypothetical protein